RKNIKKFDEKYFLCDPNFLIKTHFPEDKKWMFIEKPISKREFKLSPVTYGNYYNLNFSELKLPKGKIKNKIQIEFSTNANLKNIFIGFENKKETFYMEMEREENAYKLSYKFDKRDRGVFYVFINNQAVWGFKL